MTFYDMYTSNMLFGSIPKINSGYIILDTIYFLLLTSTIYFISNINFKKYNLLSLINFDKTNKLVYSSSKNNTSKRFRAIMYFISKNNNLSIKKLMEITDIKYSHVTDSYEETKETGYRVDQTIKFNIDKDIYGKVYYSEKEIFNDMGKSKYEEIIYLEIFSKNLSLLKLQEWVECRLKEYQVHIKSKILDKQLLVEINWNNENKNINVNYNSWESNVTFDNRFFTNKNDILEKINFFTNNFSWYKERGIPWTLGFLLWGKPGCGKTGFIKALMNLTKRNAISIKLNNTFDLNKLKKIIYDDEINEDLIIPQKNRIIIFEDIDCMSDIVLDRDLKDLDKENIASLILKYKDMTNKSNINKDFSNTNKDFSNINKDFSNTNDDNNLSNLLNILDGLQECPGRIIIMTTNKPEKLDPALIRSGRIDFKIEFTFATLKDVENIISFYWNDNNIHNINSDVELKYSHADIVNMCRTSNNIIDTIDKINSLK